MDTETLRQVRKMGALAAMEYRTLPDASVEYDGWLASRHASDALAMGWPALDSAESYRLAFLAVLILYAAQIEASSFEICSR